MKDQKTQESLHKETLKSGHYILQDPGAKALTTSRKSKLGSNFINHIMPKHFFKPNNNYMKNTLFPLYHPIKLEWPVQISHARFNEVIPKIYKVANLMLWSKTNQKLINLRICQTPAFWHGKSITRPQPACLHYCNQKLSIWMKIPQRDWCTQIHLTSYVQSFSKAWKQRIR